MEEGKEYKEYYLDEFFRKPFGIDYARLSIGKWHSPGGRSMPPPADFEFDVFVSHSSQDFSVVHAIAERLKKDGVRVWFAKWEIKPGDSIPAKIEYGLERSRVLVLCMSKNAFGSDWAQLESGTFRFRDPLNKDRRFIPLRLDDSPAKGSLGQFLYIDWTGREREQAYATLLQACQIHPGPTTTEAIPENRQTAKIIQLDFGLSAHWTYSLSSDRERALTAADDNTVRLLDVRTGRCLRTFSGHSQPIHIVVWSADQRRALSGSRESVRIWDLDTGECLREIKDFEHKNPRGRFFEQVSAAAWSPNQEVILIGGGDGMTQLWHLPEYRILREFKGHREAVTCVAWNTDQSQFLTGGRDSTVRLWDVKRSNSIGVFEGHTAGIRAAAWSPDQRKALSGSNDNTLRLWEIATGRCLRVFQGHAQSVASVAWHPDGHHILSGSTDKTVRLWNADTGECLCVLQGHEDTVGSVAWHDRVALSCDRGGLIRRWDLSEYLDENPSPDLSNPVAVSAPTQTQYTNAKVLLVGESGAGKTGLSNVLAGKKWQPSDSTVGAWATHWKLAVSPDESIEREIWLWDFGGQADQRLIHQLYMDETALAALIFDGQKEDVFEMLGQWDRDLTRASSKEFSKLLVAGRVDAGGLRVSRSQIESFRKERGYLDFLETSAKTGTGCEELKEAIFSGIKWEEIPWRSSPMLFKLLKEEIIRLKDSGRVLMRFNELRETLQLRLFGENARFTDDDLKAVVGLLAGPGVVWELKFGHWVLLQPERINAYAQAVIQTLREDQDERGCISEERVLKGDLTYLSSIQRLDDTDERFVLLAMHQMLIERGLCLREHTDKGTLLVFPSYYRRERPELAGHPAVLVSYRFNGFLDDIYATLVVRLHHTKPFEQDQLWRYAADFRTLTKKQLGLKLTRRAEGAGEIEVYFAPTIPMEEKIIFSKYIQEHLLQRATSVHRLRHYICPHCFTPVGNREIAMKRLEGWLHDRPDGGPASQVGPRIGSADPPTIICSECEKRIPLWDDMEQSFASPQIQERVRELQRESAIVLDNESKERALVGDVISTVALAGQICREFNVSDHGIDMEIEFKSNSGQATGRRVYLQLKSGDSYLTRRKSDDSEIFKIEKARHADYWREQAFPVLLLIRNSKGAIRWMDVSDSLRREDIKGKKPVRQIVFTGERFDVMSVRRWRDAALTS